LRFCRWVVKGVNSRWWDGYVGGIAPYQP